MNGQRRVSSPWGIVRDWFRDPTYREDVIICGAWAIAVVAIVLILKSLSMGS